MFISRQLEFYLPRIGETLTLTRELSAYMEVMGVEAQDKNWYVVGDYILDDQTSKSSQTLYIYDEDVNLVKSFTLAQLGVSSMNDVGLISQNIFTNDNTWTWLRNNGNGQCEIVTEGDHVLATLPGDQHYSGILKVSNKYLLAIAKGNDWGRTCDIYSLPGNGEATDVSEVSAPQKNARKYLHNDQVLIESNEKTYTIQGQEVK